MRIDWRRVVALWRASGRDAGDDRGVHWARRYASYCGARGQRILEKLTRRGVLATAKLHDIDLAKYVLEGARAVDRGEILLPWQKAAAENQAAVKTG
jgi:hypothetical protein